MIANQLSLELKIYEGSLSRCMRLCSPVSLSKACQLSNQRPKSMLPDCAAAIKRLAVIRSNICRPSGGPSDELQDTNPTL